MELLQWLVDNWVGITAALGSIVAGASLLVKITKTKKDDTWWNKNVVPVLNILAINPADKKQV